MIGTNFTSETKAQPAERSNIPTIMHVLSRYQCQLLQTGLLPAVPAFYCIIYPPYLLHHEIRAFLF